MTLRLHGWLSLVVVVSGLALVPRPALCEPFSTLYLGFGITADAPYRLNGAPLPPSAICLAQCSSAKSAVGGLRVGYWLKGLPWLGFAGDFSAFVAGWGIESPYEVTAYPISPLVMLRGRLVRREGYDNGRVQPFLALGPSLLISNATVNSGWAIVGTSQSASTMTADIGLDARIGVEILTADWFGVTIEYRYLWAEPAWEIEGQKIESKISANQFMLGLGIHY
jgi:hypothetical protein